MAYSREVCPVEPSNAEALTSAMAGIGMRFAERPASDANIEDTLLFASVLGMDESDLRVLAVLVTWFGVHHPLINADRLTRLVATNRSARVRGLWSALAVWQKSDRRYLRLGALSTGPRVDLLTTGTDFQIRRHGEDSRFVGTCLRVPANVLRDRPADVLSPEEIAKTHGAYRYRLMMGPSYRADCWAAVEAQPHLSAADLARAAYASFATAWQVKRDFAIFAAAVHSRGGRGKSRAASRSSAPHS